MPNQPDTPTLDDRVRAAWEEQVEAAVKTPGLPELIRSQPELLSRFAAYYTQLRALPRHAAGATEAAHARSGAAFRAGGHNHGQ
jgi:hypothetical protein